MRGKILATKVIIQFLALSLMCGGTFISGLAHAEPIKPEGTVVIAVPSLGSERWLAVQNDEPSQVAVIGAYEPLLYRDIKTGKIVESEGHLAETWAMSPDAKTYTFNLRKGVQFHDGRGEFTAKDVKFTLELAMAKESINVQAGYFRELIDSIEIVNRYKVVIHLKKPSYGFRNRLTEMTMNLPIACKAYYDAVGAEKYNRHPIGTGPYKFVEHKLGESVKLEAVENHWRNTPSVQHVIVKAIPELAGRIAALKAGEADICSITYDFIPELERAGIKIKSLEMNSLPSICLAGQYVNPKYDPADTPPWAKGDYWKIDSPGWKVRKALSLAINRQEIVESVLRDRGTVDHAVAFSFMPQQMGFDLKAKPDPFDPNKARQLLAEAGYSKPSDVHVVVDLGEHYRRPYGALVLQAAAMMWQTNLGIKVKFQKSEWSTVMAQTGGRKATYAWAYPSPGYADGVELLAFYTKSTGRQSYTGESLELDKLMDQALAAVSIEDMKTTKGAVFKYVQERIPAIPVCYADLLFAMDPKLEWEGLPGSVAMGIHYWHNFRYAK